jgi:hypothetical protein
LKMIPLAYQIYNLDYLRIGFLRTFSQAPVGMNSF